jgi:hypothetical protein
MSYAVLSPCYIRRCAEASPEDLAWRACGELRAKLAPARSERSGGCRGMAPRDSLSPLRGGDGALSTAPFFIASRSTGAPDFYRHRRRSRPTTTRAYTEWRRRSVRPSALLGRVCCNARKRLAPAPKRGGCGLTAASTLSPKPAVPARCLTFREAGLFDRPANGLAVILGQTRVAPCSARRPKRGAAALIASAT